MDFKKMNRKGELTMTTLIISIIAIMFIFITMFQFFTTKVNDANISVPDKYNESYTRILDSQEDLDTNLNDISNSAKEIGEASDVFSVALNGFKGLGSVILLFLNFVSIPFNVIGALLIPLDFVPQYQKTLLVMGVTAVVIFLIIANAKGEPKT